MNFKLTYWKNPSKKWSNFRAVFYNHLPTVNHFARETTTLVLLQHHFRKEFRSHRMHIRQLTLAHTLIRSCHDTGIYTGRSCITKFFQQSFSSNGRFSESRTHRKATEKFEKKERRSFCVRSTFNVEHCKIFVYIVDKVCSSLVFFSANFILRNCRYNRLCTERRKFKFTN